MFRRSIPFKSDGIFSMVADSRHREKTFIIKKQILESTKIFQGQKKKKNYEIENKITGSRKTI